MVISERDQKADYFRPALLPWFTVFWGSRRTLVKIVRGTIFQVKRLTKGNFWSKSTDFASFWRNSATIALHQSQPHALYFFSFSLSLFFSSFQSFSPCLKMFFFSARTEGTWLPFLGLFNTRVQIVCILGLESETLIALEQFFG